MREGAPVIAKFFGQFVKIFLVSAFGHNQILKTQFPLAVIFDFLSIAYNADDRGTGRQNVGKRLSRDSGIAHNNLHALRSRGQFGSGEYCLVVFCFFPGQFGLNINVEHAFKDHHGQDYAEDAERIANCVCLANCLQALRNRVLRTGNQTPGLIR